MDAEKGGGPVIDKAVHTYDICRYLFGSPEALAEPTSVYATTARFQETHSAIDTASAVVNFDSGDCLAMLLSWGLPPGAKATSIQDAIGPKGHLAFGAPPEVTKDVDTRKYRFITITTAEEPIYYKFESNSHMKDQLHSFIKAIIEDAEPEVTAYDGRRALEMGLAILESGRTGRVVELSRKKGAGFGR
jgi:predicted dehydrogenase